MKRLAAFLAALLLCLPLASAACAETADFSAAASGAYLIEAGSGRVLYQKDAHVRLPMASTTKIMTALIAIEQGDLDAMVAVPDEAYGTEGSSLYLNRDEKMRLRDMLYGLMLRSGNDAAIAIACHIAGSTEAFAARMNERAASLGLSDTHFVTPNGLHDEAHYTTAADLAVLTAAAMENAAFRAIVSAQYYKTASGDCPRTFQNKNKTLWQYEGGCGVKTGYTKAAGKCLVIAAERDGMLIIGTLLNCPDLWNTAFSMLDYGFKMYALRCLVDPALPVGIVSVAGGTKKSLEIYPKHAILFPMERSGGDEVEFRVSLPEEVDAPVFPGETIGELTLLVNGREASRTELIAASGVPGAGLRYYIGALLRDFIAS